MVYTQYRDNQVILVKVQIVGNESTEEPTRRSEDSDKNDHESVVNSRDPPSTPESHNGSETPSVSEIEETDEALSAAMKAFLEIASIIPGISDTTTICKIVFQLRMLYDATQQRTITGVDITKAVAEIVDELAVTDKITISRLRAILTCITLTDKVGDDDNNTIETFESFVLGSVTIASLIPVCVPFAVSIKIATLVAIATRKAYALVEPNEV